MSDDVLKRVEACLAGLDDESLNQHPYGLGLVRDLAAAVRDLRAWQAAAMANHKDFERSQRELHERAEKAERALAEVRALLAEVANARELGSLEHFGIACEVTWLPRVRAFLAAHPAPACPGGKHCPHYPECGTRADPRPAPREEDWGSNIEALIRKCQREGIPHTVYTRAPEPLAPGVSVEVPPARVHIPNLPAGWECGCRECMCDGDSHAWDPEKGCPEPPAPKCAWHWKGTQVGPGMHAPGCPAAKREGGGQ